MTDTFNHSDPRTFEERLAKLTGESTYRMPVEGRSTRSAQVPPAHQLAQALAYARLGANDVGPDVLFDIVTGRTTYAQRCVRLVAQAMCADRNRAARRCRPYMRIIVWAAYATAVGGMRQDQLRPAEVDARDWDLLTEGAERILLSLAEQALQRAERAFFAREAA
jgi:hypothetical protein